MSANNSYKGDLVSVLKEVVKGLKEDSQKVELLLSVNPDEQITGKRVYKQVATLSEDVLKGICYAVIEPAYNVTQMKQATYANSFMKQFIDKELDDRLFIVGRIKASSAFYDVYVSIKTMSEKLALTEVLRNEVSSFEASACHYVDKKGSTGGSGGTTKQVPVFDLDGLIDVTPEIIPDTIEAEADTE